MLVAYLALIGRILLLGVEGILIKKLGEKANSVGVTFLFFGIATPLIIPFALWEGLPSDWSFLQYVAVSGLLYAVGFVLYTKAFSEGEASLVAPLNNFKIFFLVILTTIFLGESLSLQKLAGLALLVYGTTFLNRQGSMLNSLKALFREKACLLMMGTSILVAISRTIDGFALQNTPPIAYATAIYLEISVILLAYLVVKGKVGETLEILRKKPVIALATGAENAYSYVFLLIAFTGIEVSVAEPASLLGMVITVVLAHFIFKEEIRGRLVASAIMVLGAWLLLAKF